MSALLNRTDWYRPPTRRGTPQEVGLLGLTEAEREEIQARIALARMAKAEPDPAPWYPPGARRAIGAERVLPPVQGIPGVDRTPSGRFAARARKRGARVHLGTFDTEAAAAAAIADHIGGRPPKQQQSASARCVYPMPSGRFVAKARWDNAVHHLGTFDTMAEAAAAVAAFRESRPTRKPGPKRGVPVAPFREARP